jgi:hypothetical protein
MSLGDLNATESGRGVYVLKQSANIYTMLLILSFIFVLIGCLFLFLEMKAYDLTIKVPPDDKAPQAFWSPAEQSFMNTGWERNSDPLRVEI